MSHPRPGRCGSSVIRVCRPLSRSSSHRFQTHGCWAPRAGTPVAGHPAPRWARRRSRRRCLADAVAVQLGRRRRRARRRDRSRRPPSSCPATPGLVVAGAVGHIVLRRAIRRNRRARRASAHSRRPASAWKDTAEPSAAKDGENTASAWTVRQSTSRAGRGARCAGEVPIGVGSAVPARGRRRRDLRPGFSLVVVLAMARRLDFVRSGPLGRPTSPSPRSAAVPNATMAPRSAWRRSHQATCHVPRPPRPPVIPGVTRGRCGVPGARLHSCGQRGPGLGSGGGSGNGSGNGRASGAGTGW